MRKDEIKPYIRNGVKYYNYCLGAVYTMQPGGEPDFDYKIASCRYTKGTEYYEIECDGVILNTIYSAGDLAFLLSMIPNKQTVKGRRMKLPTWDSRKYVKDVAKNAR